ncbi:growth-regulating factor 1 isoform X2 [Populus alba]|uniref:Growth-regulating factor n=3 Tax=Populus TaxID=3689 RepID=A0A4U5P4S8_POPAL|nr:growth-regulating factor 1-like isoform X2 [Populus alba]KAJ7007085.1 growth-regulating factor 1-like isoform X2 [Populus alba x Populus x berolinensis]TKR91319.1 growth-regulating factor 1-like isoform X3 [Populus alba]
MDFGVQVGLDGLVGSDTSNSGFASLASSDPEAKRKYGSGFLKQERSAAADDDWRNSKLSKTESMMIDQRNTLLLKSSNNSLFTDGQQQQQMLSFSCPKSASSVERSYPNAILPYFHLTSSAYNRNTGYNSGIFNAASMHGVLNETRWPFTQLQWMELEHQALIYKYITANVPIPSNLLIPVRKALDSAGFSSFSGGLFKPSALQCGTFHMGFSSNTDPEPGRCRRTDGKKWRCSRDVVADQKYCERHMNRGRHRSRKPVEGQSGHSAAATTTLKPMANGTSSFATASVVGLRSAVSDSHVIVHNQQQPASSSHLSATNTHSRVFLTTENVGERMQDASGLSMLPSSIDLKSKETPFFVPKQQNSYGESLQNEFALVTSDCLLNHSQKSSSLMNCRNFGSSQDLTDQESVSQHSLRQFMDDCPKSHSDRSVVAWPELDLQSERTQLSISIPMVPAGFMSSTSSPKNEKISLSPLRLSREFDPIQMGLGVGVGSVANEPNQRQANWIPVSWETSMGGPLGEVLHNTNNNATAECKNDSSLKLMTERWDNSPRVGSSPTGVLQKSAFASLSNSSAGSSPRTENKTIEGGNLCNDLGSNIVHSSSLPAL